MPMRSELYIPAGHPLAPKQSARDAWRELLGTPDLAVFIGMTVIGLCLSLYLALCWPLPPDLCIALMMLS